MSPTLFNVFIDFLARQVAQRCQQLGVQGFKVAYRISGQLMQVPASTDSITTTLMLLYADDLVLLADDAAALRTALLQLEAVATDWGMSLNYSKTKVVRFGATEQQPQPSHMQLANGLVDVENTFCYLGSVITGTGQQDTELNRRLQAAGAAFHQLWREALTAQGIALATKMRLYKTVVVPTLLYGAPEAWALTQQQQNRMYSTQHAYGASSAPSFTLI
jgi:hypothetical protein